MKYCPHCGTANDDVEYICKKCGYRLPQPVDQTHVQCPNCTNINVKSADFCTYCGYQLKYVPNNNVNDISKFDTNHNNEVSNNNLVNRSNNQALNKGQVKLKDINDNISHRIDTALNNIKRIENESHPQLHYVRGEDGKVIEENDDLLKQAYATKYPNEQIKLPNLIDLVHKYNLPIYNLRHKINLINKMMTNLNSDYTSLKIPKYVWTYSKLFYTYLMHVKGDQGEYLAYKNLRSLSPYKDVNLRFIYREYYKHKCKKLLRKKYSISNQKLYNKYYYLYKTSPNVKSSRNNNQIDILYISHYGIFIFEVKNYNHNEIWIDEDGRIAWENPRHKTGPRINRQGYNFLSIDQQMKLHDAALLTSLKHSNFNFTKEEYNRIKDHLFNILVYIKKIPNQHILGGVYCYDKSVKRNHSSYYRIHPVDQNECLDEVQKESHDYIFSNSLVKRLKDAISPESERDFKLPKFTRENIKTLNSIIDYKNEINYVFKSLRHVCYKQGILNKIMKPDSYDYHQFMIERDKSHQFLMYCLRKASYKIYNRKVHRWVPIKHKSYMVKQYHRRAKKKYYYQKKNYEHFYK